MESGLFGCPADLKKNFPIKVRYIETFKELSSQSWEILGLMHSGCERLGSGRVDCRILLVPGECSPIRLADIHAETVISYGMSSRDSLTLSSLQYPTLCVQRTLFRPDGERIEPQEFPLGSLPGSVQEILPLLGMKLLQMPLTKRVFSW